MDHFRKTCRDFISDFCRSFSIDFSRNSTIHFFLKFLQQFHQKFLQKLCTDSLRVCYRNSSTNSIMILVSHSCSNPFWGSSRISCIDFFFSNFSGYSYVYFLRISIRISTKKILQENCPRILSWFHSEIPPEIRIATGTLLQISLGIFLAIFMEVYPGISLRLSPKDFLRNTSKDSCRNSDKRFPGIVIRGFFSEIPQRLQFIIIRSFSNSF